MDRNTEPNGKRIADQSAYPRFHWGYLRTQSGKRIGIWQELSNQTLVQTQSRHNRLDYYIPDFPLAR